MSSLSRELEFRANFIAKLIQNAFWIGYFLLVITVIYSNTKAVAGWNGADALVLAASIFISSSVAQALFFSLQDIPQAVRLGTLDFVITKPLDTQFWVSVRRFNFDQIGSILAGLVMLYAGVVHLKAFPTLTQWSSYLVMLFVSLGLYYCLTMALMTTAIWLVRIDNLSVLTESATNVARYPTDIYTNGIQRFLTYVIPFAFLATIPARQLTQGFDATSLLLSVGWLVAAFVACRLFWRFALTQYGSASS